MTAPGYVPPSRPGWWVKHGGDVVIGGAANTAVTVGLTVTGSAGVDSYAPLQIPNRNVGPMALRQAFRRAQPWAAWQPAIDPTDFVTRDPATGNLMLHGQRFRFGGANAANDIGLVGSANGNNYGGVVHADASYLTTHAQVDAYLNSAAAMHLGVVKATWSVHTTNRVDSVEPTLGSYNAAALDPIDYAIQQCKLRGIRLVIPFAEEYTVKPWYVSVTGGGATDNFYTRTATINAYKGHISFVLNHVNPYTGVALKNESAVLCWQIGNEFLAPTITEAQYITWQDDIGGHIKVVEGAQQLVQDGHYGPYGLAATYIDIYDQHSYDQFRTPAYLTNQGGDCHAAGKAYFVGEFTWTDVNTDGFTALPWTLDNQLDAWERSPYIDGSSFWDLLAPLTIWSEQYTLHYPGDNTDMQSRADMLADHAQRMAVITPKVFALDTFTGADGTALSSHVGEIGATWDLHGGYTGIATIQNNRIWAGTNARYYASGVPASGDYTVSADIYVASTSDSIAGVAIRSRTKSDNSYTGHVQIASGVTTCYLLSYPGATTISFAGITTPTAGSTHNLKLRVEGTSLSLYWDGVRVVGPSNISAYLAAGRAGFKISGATSTTGLHIETFTASDPLPGVQAPAPSLVLPFKRRGRLNYGALQQL